MMYILARMAGAPVAIAMSPLNQNVLYNASGRNTSMRVRWFGKQSRAKQEKKHNRPKLVQKKPLFEPSLAILKDDGQWYLPAGTQVKHGTTTNNLRSIFQKGILPGDRGKGRSKNRPEPELQQGVYAASCYLAYVMTTVNLMFSLREHKQRRRLSFLDCVKYMLSSSTREGALSNLRDIAQKLLGEVDDNILQNFGFPCVLNIVLQEDVAIRADEDFLDKSRKAEERVVRDAAGFVWEHFGSCILLVDKVPASWIKSVEIVETDHRNEYWELMLYLVSENPILELALLTARKKSLHEEKQFDGNKMNSKMRIEQDIKNLRLARSICQQDKFEARKLWHEQVVKQVQRSNVFSQLVLCEDVHVVLDELEKDKRRFLATIFSLCEALQKSLQ
jgi:hypothetical protein